MNNFTRFRITIASLALVLSWTCQALDKFDKDECEREMQLGFHFEFPEEQLRTQGRLTNTLELTELFKNLGWNLTTTYKFVGRNLVNDFTLLSASDKSGRYLVLPYAEFGQAVPRVSSRDQDGINKILLGTRSSYVLEAAQPDWHRRLTADHIGPLLLKSALKELGFAKVRVLRQATVFEGSAIYNSDGVIVMEAPWGSSSITLLDRQYKRTSRAETEHIVKALKSGTNYTTVDALAGLRRGKIEFRER